MENTEQNEQFEPKVLAFVCNWCTYAGADLAGTSRIQYPPNVKIIRLMCSGSVDPIYIVKALLDGIDGVFIGGCHPGDCHYQSGNYKARRRVAILKKILEEVGFDPDRVYLQWISASEGKLFAQTISRIVDELKKKGPNSLKKIWHT